jgi:leucyl-tRNA synthetase
VEKLVLCLAPFAPHLAEELWQVVGHEACAAENAWPAFDPVFCVDEVVEIAVQVNGKVRGRIELSREADEKSALEAAQGDPNVQKFLEGKTLKKVIYVPAKILNLIVQG